MNMHTSPINGLVTALSTTSTTLFTQELSRHMHNSHSLVEALISMNEVVMGELDNKEQNTL